MLFSSDRRDYLYSKLPLESRHLLRVPRTARLVALLPPQRFAELKSTAHVFWEVYTYRSQAGVDDAGLIQAGLRAQRARSLGYGLDEIRTATVSRGFLRRQIELAMAMLGAIAFEMLVINPDEPLFSLATDEVQTPVFDRMKRAQALAALTTDDSYLVFCNEWDRVLAMDSVGLQHFIFSTDERDDYVEWSDISTMAFFAAHWVCKWGDDTDRQRLWRWFESGADDVFRETWRFAAELPAEAVDPDRRIAMFAPVYDRSINSAWATEFIFHSWERMQGTRPQQDFLAEFPAICAGAKGQEARRIAESMLAGFVPLAAPDSQLPGDTGEFWMGSPEDEEDRFSDETLHRVRLRGPYRLHKCCVTNQEYQLFAPGHEARRVFRKRIEGSVSRHPVVDVSWFDAWTFARWCGCRLPSEAEWEYACRAGQETPFSFGPGHSGETCTADVCNFDGRYPYGKDRDECTDEEQEYRGHTIGVDRLSRNGWGLYQMHGNVLEWCWDWYDGRAYERRGRGAAIADTNGADVLTASARVLRGGCWYDVGRCCRSADRGGFGPGYRDHVAGFRLATVLEPRSGKGEQAEPR